MVVGEPAGSPALRRFVISLEGFRETAPARLRRTEYPVPFVVLILELGPPLRFWGAQGQELGTHVGGFIAGIGDGPTTMEHDGMQECVQVNLTFLGARLLAGQPLSAFANRPVSVDDALAGPSQRLSGRLASVPDWEARFDIVLGWLETRLASEVPFVAPVVEWACRQIAASRGNIRTSSLARELGYSERHLCRLFLDYVGVTPKTASRVARFHALTEQLRETAAPRWPRLRQSSASATRPI